MKKLNLALKMAIHKSGRTQKRIAKLAHIKEIRLSSIVNNRRDPPTPEEKDNLALVLKTSVAELFPETTPTAERAPEAVAS